MIIKYGFVIIYSNAVFWYWGVIDWSLIPIEIFRIPWAEMISCIYFEILDGLNPFDCFNHASCQGLPFMKVFLNFVFFCFVWGVESLSLWNYWALWYYTALTHYLNIMINKSLIVFFWTIHAMCVVMKRNLEKLYYIMWS